MVAFWKLAKPLALPSPGQAVTGYWLLLADNHHNDPGQKFKGLGHVFD